MRCWPQLKRMVVVLAPTWFPCLLNQRYRFNMSAVRQRLWGSYKGQTITHLASTPQFRSHNSQHR